MVSARSYYYQEEVSRCAVIYELRRNGARCAVVCELLGRKDDYMND